MAAPPLADLEAKLSEKLGTLLTIEQIELAEKESTSTKSDLDTAQQNTAQQPVRTSKAKPNLGCVTREQAAESKVAAGETGEAGERGKQAETAVKETTVLRTSSPKMTATPDIHFQKPPPSTPPLWAIKTLYFCQSACIASLCRFIVVLYTNLGLSAFWIGVLQFGDPMASFIGQLFWAYACDQLDQKKLSATKRRLSGTTNENDLPAAPVSNFRWVISSSVMLSIVGYVALYLFTWGHGGDLDPSGRMQEDPNPPSPLGMLLLLIIILFAAFCRSGTAGVLDGLALTVVEEKQKEANEEAVKMGRKQENDSESEPEESYGSQRVWGAVGWGIVSLLTGILVDKFGVMAMFAMYITFSLFGVGVMWATFPAKAIKSAEAEAVENGAAIEGSKEVEAMDVSKGKVTPIEKVETPVTVDSNDTSAVVVAVPPATEPAPVSATAAPTATPKTADPKKEKEPQHADSAGAALSSESISSLLRHFDTLWFFLNLLAYGINMAMVETFLFVYLERCFVPPATKTLLGSTVAIMTLFEIPIFLRFERIRRYLKKMVKTGGGGVVGSLTRMVGGDPNRTVLVFCQCIFAIRCFLYACLPIAHPIFVLLIEPLHGLTYAAMWAASVSYANEQATKLNPGLRTTAQALCHGFYQQFGLSFGGVIWGFFITMAGASISVGGVATQKLGTVHGIGAGAGETAQAAGTADESGTADATGIETYQQAVVFHNAFTSCYLSCGICMLFWGVMWIVGWRWKGKQREEARRLSGLRRPAVEASSATGGLTQPLLAN